MFMRTISLVSDNKVYHKNGCPYLAKVKKGCKRQVDVDSKPYKKYRACKYCGGVRGWARIFHKRPERKTEERRMECWYDDRSGHLFVKTWIGCWKLCWKEQEQIFWLFHRNRFENELGREELMRGNFHKQRDMPSSKNFDSLIHYIYGHDTSKEIAAEDYRKLPQNSRKQKRYYRHHKRMADKDRHRRLDELFKQIESKPKAKSRG